MTAKGSGNRYSYETHQRAVNLKTTDVTVEPSTVETDDTDLNISWKDGRNSCYNISWLEQNYQSKTSVPPRLWKNCDQSEVLGNSQVAWTDFMSSDDTGVKAFLSSMIK